MNIFYCANNRYSQHIAVSMVSVIENNLYSDLNFYVISNDLSDSSKARILRLLNKSSPNSKISIEFVKPEIKKFASLKLNIPHISIETYFRYVIPECFPSLDKGLYLDADTVVNSSIEELYNTNIEDYYIAGVRDTYIEKIDYKKTIKFSSNDLYVNAGVLLFNLKKIRDEQLVEKLFLATKELSSIIQYQDQDILNIVFKNNIKELPRKYNYTFCDVVTYPLSELTKASIIHFTGDKKPWDFFYKSQNVAETYYYKYLKESPYRRYFYKKIFSNLGRYIFSKTKSGDKRSINILGINFQYEKNIKKAESKKNIKVALLVDEFFGGAGTAYGGYGFLARRYLAKYLPDSNIRLDLLLGFSKRLEHQIIDEINVYRLPKDKKLAKNWLKSQGYDVYLSIELTSSSYEILKLEEEKKNLVLWVQDPRPWYEWREINTVQLYPETCYWDTPVYEYVNFLNWKQKVKFITQGVFLIDKARDLYRLNNDLLMEYVPNPIDVDYSFNVKEFKKKDQIIFLGRIESVKRGWLFCEIAKSLPEYDFYVLGQTFREKGKNSEIINKYASVPNLHFAGHVDGEVKKKFLMESKILVNTSIHEALPISFLEALSYGTVIVSNRNPENLTEKFGYWTGDVLGDGFDKVHLYVEGIRKILNNELNRQKMAESAVTYIREIHNTKSIITKIKKILMEEANRS